MASLEKRLGALTTLINGIAVVAMQVVAERMNLIANPAVVAAISVVGHATGFTLDMLFAKKSFLVGGREVPVPYDQLGKRLGHLRGVVFSPMIARVGMTIAIDTIVAIALYKVLRNAIKDTRIERIPYINGLLVTAVTSLTFVMYLNVLRFDWAYKEVDRSPVMDLLVALWLTSSVILYSRTDAVL